MNLKNIADTFFNRFNSNHVLLYVGQNANDEELRTCIAACPWSAVITSRRDPELAVCFANGDRTVLEYPSRADIPAKPLSRKKLPVLRLFGVQGETAEDDDLSWLQTTGTANAEYDMYKAREFLEFLPDILDHVNPLVIIGATSDIDWKIIGSMLARILYQRAGDGSVSVWDLPETVDKQHEEAYTILKTLAEKKHFELHPFSVAQVIQTRSEAFASALIGSEEPTESDVDVYYQGDRPVSITQSDLLMFKNVGTLLTERTLHQIRPLGKDAQRQWFNVFLESGALLGPQWYGYLPQSTFYVKRSYEDALVQLVKKALEGRGVTGSATDPHPIILSGDPGSSKSISLGALAYRIYCEKAHPVIYIARDSFLSAQSGLDELDEALQFLEKNAPVDTRILIIWDSSAYRTGIDRARKLLQDLLNRGRRVVLVCSGYNMHRRKDEPALAFHRLSDAGNGRFEPCDESEAQVCDLSGCYFVKATREINEREQAEFWKIVREYSGISNATISQFRQKLIAEKRTEIFDYYYLLITVLRENLEEGLRSEQSKVYPYVEKKLQQAIGEIRAEKKMDKQLSPMFRALVAAGLDPASLMAEEETSATVEDEELNAKLDLFNMCVALFSRFKLTVPYNLAYTLLLGEESTEQYSESGRNLYEIVTTEIPWIHYGEDENGDFSFRFRNPLEADIFLRNHDFTGEQQIDLLCRIIDIYGTDYRRSRCLDLSFTDSLQSLLRLMGPNSTYTPFLTAGKYEHESVLRKLDVLIQKVEELHTEYGVEDEDAGFAAIIITFTREYYGSIWDQLYAANIPEDMECWEHDPTHYAEKAYEERIDQLLRVIALAESNIEKLELKAHSSTEYYGRQHLLNQRYSLAVEIAQCNMWVEEIGEEYARCCAAHGNLPRAEYINRKLSYPVLFRRLWTVISSRPTNGHAYNTLFKAFERMYERETLSEAKKLQYLSEIMQVVELCESLDNEIINRGSHGRDELTDRINHIRDFSTGLQISLESIRRHRAGEAATSENEQLCFDIYDEMLEANNAAAITFICRKELPFCKGYKTLNEHQHLRCRAVYEFMKEPDNFECISHNAQALAMLIRVFWMLHNNTTLVGSPECQVTRLTRSQWVEINKYCALYTELAGDQKQPLFLLIHALSTLQISGPAEYGYHQAIDILSAIPEDAFRQRRMWTPFMICDESGTPYRYTGTVISTKDDGGFIRVDRVPRTIKKDTGIRFRLRNLGRNAKMPEINQVLGELELGIGYTNFSVYTPAGRKEREAKT